MNDRISAFFRRHGKYNVAALNVSESNRLRLKLIHSHLFSFSLVAIVSGIFFGYGTSVAQAAPIKILSDSRHAYDNITAAINQLAGTGHIGTDFIVHSTNMNDGSGFSTNAANALDTTTQRYDQNGTLVPSAGPYQIFSTSATGYQGDNSISNYNTYVPQGLTYNYAYSASPVLGSTILPPTFHTAPGEITAGGTGYGVEWYLDPTLFAGGTSLSARTAQNVAIMAVLRFNHPTWNWFDVKAALRQTGSNWATGYDRTTYGFGQVDHVTADAFSDGQILLQPPAVTSGVRSNGGLTQVTFNVYPFQQSRRVKEVLFQFASAPVFHAAEMTLSEVTALGGTKITEYTGTTAATLAPISAPLTNAYFVWLTADNATDSTAHFSRIDTYAVRGPLSQVMMPFVDNFDVSTPTDNDIAATQSPTFTWTAADSYLGIAKYQLFIDGVLNMDNIIGTSTTPTGTLAAGYHTWYIKAFNNGGDTRNSTSTRTLFVIPGYAAGYTFYVDNVLGNDNNAGSQALPLATLTRAALIAHAGDTVIIIKNTDEPYREILSPSQAGVSGSPITFRGVDADHKPEIWGSDDISSGWSIYGSGNANTYTRPLASPAGTGTLAVGSSLSTLTQRTPGVTTAETLAPGEWMYDGSSTIYYRLLPGEVIGDLHIEAASRNACIYTGIYVNYTNIITRFATGNAISTDQNVILRGVEAYDAYLFGFYVYAGTSNVTIAYSKAGGNWYGLYLDGAAPNIQVYNSVFDGNQNAAYWETLNASASTLQNNIFSNSTLWGIIGVSFSSTASTPYSSLTLSHNLLDTAGDAGWDTIRGASNLELTDPLFVNAGAGNLALQSTSPGIDSGIAIAGVTTDSINNPLYGAPDIGAYEYQPPYTISTHGIDIAAGARIYGDGHFRDVAATSGTTADLSISPALGTFPTYSSTETRPVWMDISSITWDNTGNHHKQWIEASTTLGAASTSHIIGDLVANTYYNVSVDSTVGSHITGASCTGGVCLSNAQGKISFTFAGGYSTHTFDVTLGDNTAPTITNVTSTTTNGSYTAGDTINISLTFSEAVTSMGLDTITLETGATDRTCTFSVSNASTVTCAYTVQTGDLSTDLNVNSISGTMTDQVGNTMTDFTPATNLAANKDIVLVDIAAPTLTSLSPDNTMFDVTTVATDLSLTTSENATCRYATSQSIAYGSMTNFATTGSLSHTTAVTGLSTGTAYVYYTRCADASGNISDEATFLFSVAPEEHIVSTKSINIKIEREVNTFKNTLYTWKKKLHLQGNDTALASGFVKIFRNGKKIDTVDIGSDGSWSKLLKLKDDSSNLFKLRQYDQYGTFLAMKKAKVKVDTQKPEFTDFIFPLTGATAEITNLTWAATDNSGIEKYKVYVGGKIYTTKGTTFQIPRDVAKGIQYMKVKAYDTYGNTASKSTYLRVR